jgi:hypothetical protein
LRAASAANSSALRVEDELAVLEPPFEDAAVGVKDAKDEDALILVTVDSWGNALR